MVKRRILFLIWFVFINISIAFAQDVIKVPSGKPVLIDGKCSLEEWKDAAQLSMPKDYRLFLKRTDDYVFVCITPPKESNLMADLYLLAADKKPYTLHASAKLGERILEGSKWKEWSNDWDWWNVDGWWANTLKPDSFEKRSFLPGKAIEFQISRKRFTGKSWRVMVDVISNGSLIFPNNANNLKSDTWLELNLNR
jgi:hypothetical protein